ncbi:MAG: alanine racemase [Alphaproteobacteria bacterium]
MAAATIRSELAAATLTVDLAAIAANHARLRETAGVACAAAVKADAYGLGLSDVAPALARAGCETFFVAHLFEALELRALLPDADIYVLHGCPPGTEARAAEADIRPVLCTEAQVRGWPGGPAALHVDSGINRLGLAADDFRRLAGDGTLTRLDLRLLLSHLACADDPAHPMNRRQRDRFADLRALLPGVPASLANSSGIFLGPDFAFDMVRPGAALYGVNPTPGQPNPMRAVVHLQAEIQQIRRIDAGESVGYGAAFSASQPTRVAVVPVGYADGYFRCLGNRASARVAGRRVPVVGRVSMDMITLDVTAVDEAAAGMPVELIGDAITVDELAEAAGTIGYEILTALGPRYGRVYRA